MTAAVNKRTTETKYVSIFADARPDVDVTFRDVLLQRPTDHYLVGVDTFTLCSSQMSMIEPLTGDHEMLIRICRKVAPVNNPVTFQSLAADAGAGLPQVIGMLTNDGNQMTLPEALDDHGAAIRATLDAGLAGYKTYISTSEIITTNQQLLYRLGVVADSINQLMHTPGAMAPVFPDNDNVTTFGYVPDPDGDVENEIVHLAFSLGHDGTIEITGTKAFWSCFVIVIPSVQYQHGFYGTLNEGSYRRYLVVDPETGSTNVDTMLVQITTPHTQEDLADAALDAPWRENALSPVWVQGGAIPGTEPVQYYSAAQVQQQGLAIGIAQDQLDKLVLENTYALTAADERVVVLQRGSSRSYYDSGTGAAKQLRMSGVNAIAKERISVRCEANTFSTLDRRVAIEMGCSLPIKDSPMIDHQTETPDFVIGRWIYQPDTSIETANGGSAARYATSLSNNVTYQKMSDRLVYHSLMPQQKIQVLRLRLFVRIRSFDETTEEWSMRVIELPTNSTDWWHTRIHFVSKD